MQIRTLQRFIQLIGKFRIFCKTGSFLYPQADASINTNRVYISLNKCIGMLISAFYHISIDRTGTFLLPVTRHLFIPRWPDLYNQPILSISLYHLIQWKRKRSWISFVRTKIYTVQPDFAVIIHICKAQFHTIRRIKWQLKFFFIPPRSIIKIAQFSSPVRMLGIEQLQLLQLRQRLPFWNLRSPQGHKLFMLRQPELLTRVMHIL